MDPENEEVAATGGVITEPTVVANETDGVVTPVTAAAQLPQRWLARLVVEGFRTTDHRAIAQGVLTWRDTPLPLAAQFSNEPGHDGSVPVGTIETITRDGNQLLATGTFDLASEDGAEAARLCGEQILRFVSVDMEVLESTFIDLEVDWYEEITAARVGMATMVMFPAFPQACIVPEGMTLPDPEPMGEIPVEQIPDIPLIAAAGLANVDLDTPPRAWFDDPLLQEVTHLTVTDEGRVFGHLAAWGVAHRGIQGRQVYAPRSATNYAHFATGTVVCDDGTRVRTGPLTMGLGHADGRSGLRPAAAHYDDVTYGIADVAVGEDEFGIWMAGSVRSTISSDQLRVLRASDVSGDWRPVAAGHELVAALIVNVAGFLITNALVASAAYASVARVSFAQFQHDGEPGTILAAGLIRQPDPLAVLQRKVLAIETAFGPLLGLATEKLVEQMGVAS